MFMLRFNPKGWDAAYLAERNNLLYLLNGFNFKIEQIGATSVNSGRSNRNVDIMIVADSIADVSSITMKLQTQKYKYLNYLSDHEISTLVKQTRVNGYGITLRVVLNASRMHLRINAFQIYLKEDYHRVQKYNNFRAELYKMYQKDWKSYYRRKRDYINAAIDENFKFE